MNIIIIIILLFKKYSLLPMQTFRKFVFVMRCQHDIRRFRVQILPRSVEHDESKKSISFVKVYVKEWLYAKSIENFEL